MTPFCAETENKNSLLLSAVEVCVPYELVADEDVAGVLDLAAVAGLLLLGDEGEEALLGLVVRAVRDPGKKNDRFPRG